MDANNDGALASSSTGVMPMGNADVSVRTQMQKALGKYTARECTLLCEVILQQIKENSTLPGVLESDFSPAHIAWDRIAQKMLTLHRLSIRPRDAQELWKFLAYAEQPASTRKCKTEKPVHEGDGTDEELLPASDDDDYDIPVDVINEKHKQNRPNLVGIPSMMELPESDDVHEDGGIASDTTTKEANASEATEPQVIVNRPILPEEKAPSKETILASEGRTKEKNGAVASGDVVKTSVHTVENASSQGSRAVPHDPSARLRLYPVYELPTGAPDCWQKPFQLKEMLPLTFVAGTFLKRKVDLLADPKAADGGQKKPKPTKVPTSAGTANINAPTPRAPYVPSSTPPPQASPPCDAFHFFTRMFKENPASVMDAPPQVTQQPTSTDSRSMPTDATTLQQLFASASASVRSKCEQLALDDLDRYNRECVRRRIWEKAMSSQTNSPIPSPANPTAQLTSANDTSSKSAAISTLGAAQIPGSTLISSAASVTANTVMSTAAASRAMPNAQQ
uniref:Uncharacterized protein n=1 Tax=Globisporangium ultimum (strain ATCC 200006 / CBS 805.95 / DAOM BR144) TaxID=431595 RepID=K3WFA9_GLOUD